MQAAARAAVAENTPTARGGVSFVATHPVNKNDTL
jgi:hypothetical protein